MRYYFIIFSIFIASFIGSFIGTTIVIGVSSIIKRFINKKVDIKYKEGGIE